jgi:hypothetical protein
MSIVQKSPSREALRAEYERICLAKEHRRALLRAAEEDPTVFTERKMLMALAKHFDVQRNRMFVRTTAFGWEMDFCMVTGAGVIHEVEVKISQSDWQNDRKKDKWAHSNQKKVGRFWYAVPAPLISKKPEWVSEDTGLIAVTPRFCTIFRPAKLVSGYRATAEELNVLYNGMYFRLWTQALKSGEI